MNIAKLLILLLLFPVSVHSQDSIHPMDRAYGLDQTLYNGKKYNYFLPIGTKGNQYLISPLFVNGSLILKEKTYRDVNLNFDIYNQQLLLKFQDKKGVMNIIEVSKAWINGFRLGDMNFEYLSLEKNPRYFQVLGEGTIRILYFWRKSFNLEGSGGSYYYTFSAPVRDSYVLINGQVKSFNSNHSFARIFPEDQRAGIKNYMHKYKIRVKKASDKKMEDLINFIDKVR